MQRHRNNNSTRLHSKRRVSALFGLLVLGLVSTPAIAQSDYPTRVITLIVPFAAGGPTDVVARIIVNDMSRTLGQQIVVENIVGAGGTTAGIRAMRSPPDGYTIIMGHMGTHAASVALYPQLAYSHSHDLEPIGVARGGGCVHHLPAAQFDRRSKTENDALPGYRTRDECPRRRPRRLHV